MKKISYLEEKLVASQVFCPNKFSLRLYFVRKQNALRITIFLSFGVTEERLFMA